MLSVLFIVSVSAGNVTFSDYSSNYTLEQESTVEAKSNYELHLHLGTEVQSILGLSRPDILRLSQDRHLFNTDGLLSRSTYLSLNQGGKTVDYDYIFIHNSFIKDIIFPFHSFW